MPTQPYVADDYETILHRIIDDIRTRTGVSAVLLPHTIEAAFAAANAAAVHGLHRHQERCAATALWAVLFNDTYLGIWAATFGVNQKSGDKATGLIEVNGVDTTLVPTGTVWRRTADDFEYVTTEDVTLTGGPTPIPVRASTSGTIGNAKNTTPLELTQAIAGVVTGAELSEDFTDGAEPETSDQLLQRLLQRLRFPPKGGGAGDYVRWQLENKGVTRAWEAGSMNGQLPELGYITVRYVRDGNYDEDPVFPYSATDRQKIYDYIKARMPVGLEVVVPEPYNAFDPTPESNPDEYQLQALDPTIKIKPNTAAAQKAAGRVLRIALTRARLGPEVFPISLLVNALTSEELVQEFEIMDPVGNVVIDPYRVLVLGTPVWQDI